MPIESWGKSGVLAYIWLKMAILAILFEMWTSNLFCPSFLLILMEFIWLPFWIGLVEEVHLCLIVDEKSYLLESKISDKYNWNY